VADILSVWGGRDSVCPRRIGSCRDWDKKPSEFNNVLPRLQAESVLAQNRYVSRREIFVRNRQETPWKIIEEIITPNQEVNNENPTNVGQPIYW
jgi:hypothetical protein